MDNHDNETELIIPFDQLSPEALAGVIDQFISRDGGDSGHVETSFAAKRETVHRMLKSGKALLLYDTVQETCNIVQKEEYERFLRQRFNKGGAMRRQ